MEWNPKQKYRRLVSRIQDLLDDGEQRTTRDIYYALESRGYDYDYREVKRAVKKGRRAGYIDPSQIVDTSREAATTVNWGYESPRSYINQVVSGIWNRYNENFWKEQEFYVEVWLEKASLASVFVPTCEEYNVRLETTRGDWSDSKIFRATERLRERLQEGKRVRILYFGDFNPSGLHAPVAVQSTMRHYGLEFREKADSDSPGYFDIWPIDGPLLFPAGDSDLLFKRVALNLEHIRHYDLPENPTPSQSDKDRTIKKKFMSQVSDGRDVNIELNALKEFHREEFENMIEEAILEYVDTEAKQRAENRVQDRRNRLENCISIDTGKL